MSIKMFGAHGRFLRTVVRQGSGPGEQSGLFSFIAASDTIFVFGRPPMSPATVNVHTLATGHVRTLRLRADGAPLLTAIGRLSSGELLVERGTAVRVLDEVAKPGTLVPDSAWVGIFSLIGADGNGTIVWLPPIIRRWLVAYLWPNGPVPTAMSAFPLGGETFVVVSGDRVWRIETVSGTLTAYDASGTEVASVTLDIAPSAIEPQKVHLARMRALATSRRAVDSARAKAVLPPQSLPSTMPLFSAAVAGADGEVWIRRFDMDDTAPQRFILVNREGIAVARATIPAGMEIQHVGVNYLLGVSRDSLGVESIELRALRERLASSQESTTSQQ